MFRWTLFSLALASAGLGLLTVFKAPDWLSWKLVILAGEFGYWVALLPVGVAIAAGLAGRGAGPGAVATAALALAGALLLLQPCFQAWLIGRGLPADLERALGKVSVGAASVFGAPAFWPGPQRRGEGNVRLLAAPCSSTSTAPPGAGPPLRPGRPRRRLG